MQQFLTQHPEQAVSLILFLSWLIPPLAAIAVKRGAYKEAGGEWEACWVSLGWAFAVPLLPVVGIVLRINLNLVCVLYAMYLVVGVIGLLLFLGLAIDGDGFSRREEIRQAYNRYPYHP